MREEDIYVMIKWIPPVDPTKLSCLYLINGHLIEKSMEEIQAHHLRRFLQAFLDISFRRKPQFLRHSSKPYFESKSFIKGNAYR
uniref:Uncharacterized protein n=1 Tax=Medicago truncatula TaxID=3880 RepID=A2Q5Q5_MEDTR|nr:hypothetical protein MtrDRAFT_AC167711g19v2 [Medicago truncatula]